MKRLGGIFSFLVFFCAIFAVQTGYAQSQRVVQLSGVVFDQDSSALPGAFIFVPKAGSRGTVSIGSGFFSLPVVTGDSVVISNVGYKRRFYVVPENSSEFTTLVIVMSPDTLTLPVATIYGFPTEEVFKQAVLALNLPPDASAIDPSLMNSQLMATMVRTTGMDAAANYRYYMNQYPQDVQNKFMPITNPFLNVVNWARFFKQMKETKKAKDAESRKNRIPD